ncbi:TlpA disulfide reductase family protein [Tamlana sp. 2201CG12-4]|uniref:TlpA disulfide reductase family protein n=1 Tax=Tamlana sp. 2201CG12-4 TaxID=3112582 RepID=UPI002DC02989|nr:TlpA disulfide reductase family protein [Tamlana sp. 2201CG12-4]MEC3908834.1 TlpA disulfide reductase family protein [Tamlana sp. 2201CG12-4]
MKIKSLIVLFVLTSFYCTSYAKGESKRYSVTGTFNGIETGSISIYGSTIEKTIEIKDGKFFMEGELDEPQFLLLLVSNKAERISGDSRMRIFLDDSDIQVKAGFDKWGSVIAKVTNGKLHAQYEKQLKTFSILDSIGMTKSHRDVARLKGEFEKAELLDKKYLGQGQEFLDILGKTKGWKNSVTFANIMTDNFYSLPLKVAKKVRKKFDKQLESSFYVKKMDKYMAGKINVQVGKKVPDFKFKDEHGKVYTRDDFKGKTILIDFGNYYCHFCVKEVPYVVKMSQKYKDKGLVLLSVSVDSESLVKKDHERLSKYISKHKYDVNRYALSPLSPEENNNTAFSFGIDGYPYILMVNEKGVIVGTDLRSKYLEREIDNYFAKK